MSCCSGCGRQKTTRSHQALTWAVQLGAADVGVSRFWRTVGLVHTFNTAVGQTPDDPFLARMVNVTSAAASLLGDRTAEPPYYLPAPDVRGVANCDAGPPPTTSPPAPKPQGAVTPPPAPVPPPKPPGAVTPSEPKPEEPESVPTSPTVPPTTSSPTVPTSPGTTTGGGGSCCCFVQEATIENEPFGEVPLADGGTWTAPPDDPRRKNSRHVKVTIQFGWRPSAKFCPCKIQWWEHVNYYPGYVLPKDTWGDLSAAPRGVREATPGWPEDPASVSPGEFNEWSKAMSDPQDKGSKGSGRVGCTSRAQQGSQIVNINDYPGIHKLPAPYVEMLNERYGGKVTLTGVVRVYSGCPEARKAELRWHMSWTPNGGTTGGAWPSVDAPTRPGPTYPPLPKGGPPLQPDPNQQDDARRNMKDPGPGTQVGDEGPSSEADQADANNLDRKRYGRGK